MKYFDIATPYKKMNGWEKSLLELKHMMNGTYKIDDTHSKKSQKKTCTTI